MSQLVKQTRSTLHKLLCEAAQRAADAGEFACVPQTDFAIEVPQNRANGDLSANAAMVWAKELRLPPRTIAQALQTQLQLDGTPFAACAVAGPGFLNFTLGESYYPAILLDIAAAGENYGRSNYGEGKRVCVEFVSANPTGPMHMGNARGGALGDCLASVLDCVGYNVQREFLVNDAGNQILKFGLSLDFRYQQIFLGEDAVEMPEDSYHGLDILERAQEFADIHGDSYLKKDEAERRQALIDYALPKNIAAMHTNMEKYRIAYDTWFHESTLHQNGELEETIALMRERGLTYEKDGALWYKASEHGGEKDEVLIRQNGTPTYFAADIAYHRNKLLVRGFDKAIDIWGADHHGHVARMHGALAAIGIDPTRLDIVLYQHVTLTQDGKAVRMSKRTGKAISLTELLEEIPVDAVRFLFNMRDPASQMEFDLDLAVEQSAKNPVYYCQYAHARICSILRKLEGEGVLPRSCTPQELSLLVAPEERELVRHLSTLTDELVSAAEHADPARITRFCMELATLFHKFYNACRVNCEDEALRAARLFLCVCVKDTMHNMLRMFKISVPDAM